MNVDDNPAETAMGTTHAIEHSTDRAHRAEGLSRRRFLRAAAATGGGLMLSLRLPVADREAAAADEAFVPNAFIRIGADGQVVLTMPYVEMGQGTYTSIPMLIAEELEVDLKQVRLEHAPPNEKLYGNPLLGVQATGNSNAIRAAWQPLRQAGATARTMLVAAAAKRWNVDPASCRAQSGEVLHVATGRRIAYGELAADAARQPVPENVTLKRHEDFRLIGTPAKRLDTAGKVNGTAVFGIDARPPGVKIATLAQSPVFGGRVKSVDDAAAKAVKGVRQIVRLDDAVAVVADHMGAAKKGLAALVIEWDDGPHAKLSTEDIAAELEKATLNSGPVAQNIGDADKAMAGAATKVEATYQVPFLAHAALEPMNCTVHVRKDGCEVWVGNQAIARAQAAAAKGHGPAAGQGRGPQPSDRRRLRPPARERRRHPRRSDRAARRRPREGRLDPRGRYPARHVPALLVRPNVRRSRFKRYAHRLEAPLCRILGNRTVASSGIQQRPRSRHHRGRDRSGLCPPEHARRVPAGGASGHSDRLLAQRRAVAQCLRDRKLHGRTGGGGEAGSGRLSAGAPRQDAPRQGRARACGRKGRLGEALPARVGRGVSLQFVFGTYMAQVAEVEVSKDGAVRVRRVVCAVDCGTVVNPDTVQAQIQSAIIFGITAALHGEITLKNGRVEQGNFDSYQMLRMNEAPAIEVHIVQSIETPGGMGECGTSAIVPAVANAIFAATGKRLRKMPIDPAAFEEALVKAATSLFAVLMKPRGCVCDVRSPIL